MKSALDTYREQWRADGCEGRMLKLINLEVRNCKREMRRHRLAELRKAKARRRELHSTRITFAGDCKVLCFTPNDASFDGITITAVFNPGTMK